MSIASQISVSVEKQKRAILPWNRPFSLVCWFFYVLRNDFFELFAELLAHLLPHLFTDLFFYPLF